METVTDCPLSFDIHVKEGVEGEVSTTGKLNLTVRFTPGEKDLTCNFGFGPCLSIKAAEVFSYVVAHCWLTDLQNKIAAFQTAELIRKGNEPTVAKVVFSFDLHESVRNETKPHRVTFLNDAASLSEARQVAEEQWKSAIRNGFAYLDAIKSSFDPGLIGEVLAALAQVEKSHASQNWCIRADKICEKIAPLFGVWGSRLPGL